VDLDEARDVVREQHRAVLATMRQDGTPQLSPVVAGVDDAGRIVISTRETAYKTKNLRRNPRAWVCVLPDEFFGRWVQVSGDVEVVSLPDAMEPLIEQYRSVMGEHPDWDEFRAAMESERRCVVRITPTAAGPDRAG
jgi:PPOX class probable F420-dependent enzyme